MLYLLNGLSYNVDILLDYKSIFGGSTGKW